MHVCRVSVHRLGLYITKSFACETLATSAVACDTFHLRARAHPARRAFHCIGIATQLPIQ